MVISDKLSLKGKNAIITGGVGILGQTFSRALAEMGANVVILDLEGNVANELAQEISKEYSVSAMGIACDISSEESVKLAVDQVVEKYQHIHILHNNAASKSSDLKEFFAPFEDYSLDEWKKIMSVNIDGMFLMAKYVGKHMISSNIKGSIIQTASIYGVVAPDQRIYEGSEYMGMQINTPAVYSASKGAVVALTKYLASYWGEKGIRVNTLTPGGIESGQNETFQKNYSKRIPLGRMANRDEMVGALVFLASDASSYITGQNLIVDGGLCCW